MNADDLMADRGRRARPLSAPASRAVFAALMATVLGAGGGTAAAVTAAGQPSSDQPGPIADGGSYTPSMSADGHRVAFASQAKNLVPGGTGTAQGVFVADTSTGVLRRIDVTDGGQPANADSADPSISSDGRWVVFDSFATNLIPGSDHRNGEVYEHDLLTGTTVRVSDAAGGRAADGQSGLASVSADGRYVAFMSTAADLSAGNPTHVSQIYVWDRQTRNTELVSESLLGRPGDEDSGNAVISADGRFVAFDSTADNLTDEESSNTSQIYVRDRRLHTTTLISRSNKGQIGNDTSTRPSISADGRKVAFDSRATTLSDRSPRTGTGHDPSSRSTPPPSAAEPAVTFQVYLHDLDTGTTTMLSRSSVGTNSGPDSGKDSYNAKISPDGRAVAFTSRDHALAPRGRAGQTDVYLRDLARATTTRISTDPSGAAAIGSSLSPTLDAHADKIAFVSVAALRGSANPDGDVYQRDWGTGQTTRLSRPARAIGQRGEA